MHTADYQVGWSGVHTRADLRVAPHLIAICRGSSGTPCLLTIEKEAQKEDGSDHLIEWNWVWVLAVVTTEMHVTTASVARSAG
jgi:hypothetical protein